MSDYGIYSTQTFVGKGSSWLWYTEAYWVKPFEKTTTQVELKYIMQGPVCYVLEGKRHVMQSGGYTVINQDQYYEGYVKQQERSTKGLYFFLDAALLSEVHETMLSSHHSLLSHDGSVAAVREFDFVQGVHSAKTDGLGVWLKKLSTLILEGQPFCEQEMFYHTCQKFLESQASMQSAIAGIKAEKKATRVELYRRLNLARQMILDGGAYELSITDLAREAAMSEFHFLRSFKQAFGISPYQLLLDQKLMKSKELLERLEMSVSEVASFFGFSELGAFSKAFKARYGMSPSRFRMSG